MSIKKLVTILICLPLTVFTQQSPGTAIDNLKLFQGDYSKELHFDKYSKGVYLLQIKTSDNVITKKISFY